MSRLISFPIAVVQDNVTRVSFTPYPYTPLPFHLPPRPTGTFQLFGHFEHTRSHGGHVLFFDLPSFHGHRLTTHPFHRDAHSHFTAYRLWTVMSAETRCAIVPRLLSICAIGLFRYVVHRRRTQND